MDTKLFVEEDTKLKANRLIRWIEFFGDEYRSDEVLSIYKYLGLLHKQTIITSKQDVDLREWMNGMYTFDNNLLRDAVHKRKATYSVRKGFTRLKLPNYDITVTDGNPTQLMYFINTKMSQFKKKYDDINQAIRANIKCINNARKNCEKNVQIVDDFLGSGHRAVTRRDFKAYITGLSVENHNLKKRAKAMYSRYMNMYRLQDLILTSYITEGGFDNFYKEYTKVCKEHHKEDMLYGKDTKNDNKNIYIHE